MKTIKILFFLCIILGATFNKANCQPTKNEFTYPVTWDEWYAPCVTEPLIGDATFKVIYWGDKYMDLEISPRISLMGAVSDDEYIIKIHFTEKWFAHTANGYIWHFRFQDQVWREGKLMAITHYTHNIRITPDDEVEHWNDNYFTDCK